jgi:hypothetical protein
LKNFTPKLNPVHLCCTTLQPEFCTDVTANSIYGKPGTLFTDDVQTEQQGRKNSWSQFLFWFIQQQQLDPFALSTSSPSRHTSGISFRFLSVAQANRCFATDQLVNCDRQQEQEQKQKKIQQQKG